MFTIFTPFVIRTSLIASALLVGAGIVSQGVTAFSSFAQAEHARQSAIIELATSTR